MDRRKFILSLLVLGGGAAATYYGHKYIKSVDKPDIGFLEENENLIADLAETIIPSSDTPGAKEALVHQYIIHMIKNEKDIKFEKLNKEQKIAVVRYFQKEGENFKGNLGKVRNKFLGKSFFLILKEYTCIGYCTSMIGVTKGLAYEAIPSKYLATTNYTNGQKSWATK